MRKYKYLAFFTLLVIIVATFFYLRTNRDKKLISAGNVLVKKIEVFKIKNGRLPGSLTELGLPEEDGVDALYYDKRDSLHFTVSFPISAENHKFYYSDTKLWEDRFREMR